jgi:hypothetical protein
MQADQIFHQPPSAREQSFVSHSHELNSSHAFLPTPEGRFGIIYADVLPHLDHCQVVALSTLLDPSHPQFKHSTICMDGTVAGLANPID